MTQGQLSGGFDLSDCGEEVVEGIVFKVENHEVVSGRIGEDMIGRSFNWNKTQTVTTIASVGDEKCVFCLQ